MRQSEEKWSASGYVERKVYEWHLAASHRYFNVWSSAVGWSLMVAWRAALGQNLELLIL
jgi:hypothetical protein